MCVLGCSWLLLRFNSRLLFCFRFWSCKVYKKLSFLKHLTGSFLFCFDSIFFVYKCYESESSTPVRLSVQWHTCKCYFSPLREEVLELLPSYLPVKISNKQFVTSHECWFVCIKQLDSNGKYNRIKSKSIWDI